MLGCCPPRGCHGHREGLQRRGARLLAGAQKRGGFCPFSLLQCLRPALLLRPPSPSPPTTNMLLLSHTGHAQLCHPTVTFTPAAESQLAKVTSAQVQCPRALFLLVDLSSIGHWTSLPSRAPVLPLLLGPSSCRAHTLLPLPLGPLSVIAHGRRCPLALPFILCTLSRGTSFQPATEPQTSVTSGPLRPLPNYRFSFLLPDGFTWRGASISA